MELNVQDIKQRMQNTLASREKVRLVDAKRKPSAVLIPLYHQDGEYRLIFTRRTRLVRHHKGEISFPGGGYHLEDGNLLTTALRESYEEIGLQADDVEVLGQLDDIFTRGSDFIITPFLGFIQPDYPFTVSEFEIAEIMRVPVKDLLKKGCRREEPVIELGGKLIVPYIYAVQGQLIIGATARIVKQFLEIFTPLAGLPSTI